MDAWKEKMWQYLTFTFVYQHLADLYALFRKVRKVRGFNRIHIFVVFREAAKPTTKRSLKTSNICFYIKNNFSVESDRWWLYVAFPPAENPVFHLSDRQKPDRSSSQRASTRRLYFALFVQRQRMQYESVKNYDIYLKFYSYV